MIIPLKNKALERNTEKLIPLSLKETNKHSQQNKKRSVPLNLVHEKRPNEKVCKRNEVWFSGGTRCCIHVLSPALSSSVEVAERGKEAKKLLTRKIFLDTILAVWAVGLSTPEKRGRTLWGVVGSAAVVKGQHCRTAPAGTRKVCWHMHRDRGTRKTP